MKEASLFQKIRRYGIRNSFYRFYRMILRLFLHCKANQNYPYYLFRKYTFGYAIKEVNGVPLYLDFKRDEGISKELFILGKREPLTVDFLLHANFIKEGDIVVDIGANIGYYALLESRLIGNSGVVYAIEPVSKNYDVLKKNIELNKIRNIKTYKLAVSNTEKEEVKIFVRSKGNLSSLVPLPADVQGGIMGTEKVKGVTVDSFSENEIGRAPDFIRMDVEGYEYEIVKGMQNTMRSGSRLLIEFHPTILTGEQKERICELLDANYTQAVITVNPKGRVKPVTNFEKIEEISDPIDIDSIIKGGVRKGGIAHIHKLLFSSSRVFNVFIS